MLLNALVVAALIAVDQLSKWLTVLYVKPVGSIPFWDGVLRFTYAENTGMAFSLFEGRQLLLVGVTALVLVFLGVFLWRHRKLHKLARTAVLLVLGGAVGNLIDRVRLSYVVDMLQVEFFNFPIFNLADCFVVVGTGLFVIYALAIDKDLNFGKPKKEQKETSPEGEDA